MSTSLLLLILRIGSAALLLAFLGLIFWFLYRDLRMARMASPGLTSAPAALRVLENSLELPPVNSLIDLSPVTTIGRNNHNSIVLEDNYVSGEHALVSWRDSLWWLEDLGSRNGTLLNDILITSPVVISTGDIITIGGIRLKMESGARDSGL